MILALCFSSIETKIAPAKRVQIQTVLLAAVGFDDRDRLVRDRFDLAHIREVVAVIDVNRSMITPNEKQTTFIQKANEKHNFKYSYDDAQYINQKTKVKVSCPDHGSWLVTPSNHVLHGSGCPACAKANRWQGRDDRLTTESFINRAKLVHGEKYDFNKVQYSTPWQAVTVTCKIHGDFKSNYLLLKGVGCPTCAHITASKTKIANGNAIAPEARSAYDLYESTVNRITEQSYRKMKSIINPENHPRTKTGWHLDHIYSKQQGFLDGIPPEVIGHWVNLQMLDAKENRRKYRSCTFTKDELLAKYSSSKN